LIGVGDDSPSKEFLNFYAAIPALAAVPSHAAVDHIAATTTAAAA
jgi:hypothetical protein